MCPLKRELLLNYAATPDVQLSRSHVIIQGTPGTVSQVTSKYVSMVPRDGALATEKPRCALQKEIRNYQWTRYVAMVQDMCISLDFWWSLHMCVVSICVSVSLCVCVFTCIHDTMSELNFQLYFCECTNLDPSYPNLHRSKLLYIFWNHST